MLEPNDLRSMKLRPFRSADLSQRASQILQTQEGQDFSQVQFGRSMVLYRAKEHRTLELLRTLAIERVLPFLQRVVRGTLARECRRRVRSTRRALAEAIARAPQLGVPGLQAALEAHVNLMGGLVRPRTRHRRVAAVWPTRTRSVGRRAGPCTGGLTRVVDGRARAPGGSPV